jgi:superfamily II DNA or RNA helicase
MSTTTIRLRPWQRAALEKFQAAEAADFLAVATPGAGKTTFALTCARMIVAQRRCRVVVVAPTAHLKHQWAGAAYRFGLHLDPEWSPAGGKLPSDMHGVVTTYQQVSTAGTAKALRGLAADAFVVFDEIHHASDDRAWGSAVRTAFERAHRRLAISGTPFRSDTLAIPFVRYIAQEAVSDYEYGYGDALRDGSVVRPVYFPRIDGVMEWTAPDGSLLAATFQDGLASAQAAQRLRTALSLDGEWLPAALRGAHERLTRIRAEHPDAGGLVIATDQDHARGIARLLRDRLGAVAEVVTSDDPTASERIARFADSTTPWIVAVRMVSEGVDIPRLRVGVYATAAKTPLIFRQIVGRFVRTIPGRGLDMSMARRAAGAAGQHDQQWPQAFAATLDDMLGHLVDQRHNALKSRPNGVIHVLEIGLDQGPNRLQCARRATLNRVAGRCAVFHGSGYAIQLAVSPRKIRFDRQASR